MGEVATQSGNLPSTTPSLKPAARQWLKRFARTVDKADPAFDPREVPEISPERRDKLSAFAAQAREIIRPAEPEEAMTILASLEITKPKRKMSEEEARVFWRDLKADVRGMSAWGLRLACERWRQDASKRFFPTGADLKDLVAKDLEEWVEALGHAQMILNYQPPDDFEPYMTAERLAEIKKEMAK